MYDKGTQGTDAKSANSHGMAGRKPDGTPQTPQQAKKGTRDFIDGQMRDYHERLSLGDRHGANKSLGRAYHAILDPYAPGHGYSPWDGGRMLGQYPNFPGWGHFLGDLFLINLPGPFNGHYSPYDCW